MELSSQEDIEFAGDLDAFVPGATAALAGLRGAILICAGGSQIAAARAAGHKALVVLTLPADPDGDWAAAKLASEIWAFTRWAALDWAPSGTRVNALTRSRGVLLPSQPAAQAARPGVQTPAMNPTADDVAAAIGLLWRARSMTGQLIRLGA